MTSETEILIVTRQEFEEARESINKECQDFSKLEERLKNIVSAHSCFLEPILTPPPTHEVFYNSSHQTGFAASKKKVFNKRFSTNHVQTSNIHNVNNFVRKRVEDPKREVVSSLNKITRSNFELMKSKLLRLCFSRNDNADVVNELLTYLYVHPSYKDLYMNLLIEFSSRYTDLTRTSIQQFVNITVGDILTTLTLIEDVPLVSDYDLYCKYVKTKDRFLSRYHCSILLDKLFLCNNTQEEIINTLCRYVPHITNHSAIFITQMLLLFRAEYTIDMIHLSILNDIYKHISQIQNLPRKVHFQWEEILTMK